MEYFSDFQLIFFSTFFFDKQLTAAIVIRWLPLSFFSLNFASLKILLHMLLLFHISSSMIYASTRSMSPNSFACDGTDRGVSPYPLAPLPRVRAKAQNFLNWCKLFMYISSWNWVGPGCIVPWDFLGPIPSTSNLGTNIILKPPVNVSQSVLVYFQVYSICLDVLRFLFLWS